MAKMAQIMVYSSRNLFKTISRYQKPQIRDLTTIFTQRFKNTIFTVFWHKVAQKWHFAGWKSLEEL